MGKILYKDILELTQKIEEALLQTELSAVMGNLIKERELLYAKLQADGQPVTSEDTDIIERIHVCEARCIKLAQQKKEMIKKELQSMQDNKKRHTAYSRHMAPVY